MSLPRGVRNLNPGNLRPLYVSGRRVLRVGELEAIDPDGYSRFDSAENGIRALAMDLLTKFRVRRLNTVATIIARYAPSNENDTEAYIRHVCQLTGYRRDEQIDVTDPEVLDDLVVAIIRHENGPPPGEGWYTDVQITVGITRALA